LDGPPARVELRVAVGAATDISSQTSIYRNEGAHDHLPLERACRAPRTLSRSPGPETEWGTTAEEHRRGIEREGLSVLLPSWAAGRFSSKAAIAMLRP
jgi:hypothetical protein